MLMTITPRRALIAVLSLLVLGACKEGGSVDGGLTGDDSVLRFVPAETPYLFTTGRPLPDDVLDKLEPKLDDMLKAYQVVFREVFRSALAKNAEDMSTEEMQRLSAVVDELASLFSVQGLRDAGIERGSQAAVFSHGLLPVARLEVSDADLFDAAISRIEEAAGESMSVAELDGESYRYVGDDEGRLIIGVFDDSAVFTLVPAAMPEKTLKTVLGKTLPSRSIADTDTLADILETYDYSDYYIGFVDARRIASIIIDQPDDLDIAMFDEDDSDETEISPICKAEIMQIVDIAPRLVFGYNEIDADKMRGSMVVELRPDLAQELSGIAALVPGLGTDPGGLVSLGVSFNLLALREFYEARLDAMEADPYECEYFADLQAGVAKGREALNQPLPPVVYAFRGFNAVVDDIGDFDMASAQPPTDIDASILLALEDAQTMVAMGAMFSPELASLDLQPDGKPVMLDLPQMQALGQIVYAAMHENAVALSVGADAESRVSNVLNAASAQPPPMFSMTMDAGRYYALIAEAMMLENDEGEGKDVDLSLASREALRDAMLAVGELYDRMAVDIRFTERGMEIESLVTLKD